MTAMSILYKYNILKKFLQIMSLYKLKKKKIKANKKLPFELISSNTNFRLNQVTFLGFINKIEILYSTLRNSLFDYSKTYILIYTTQFPKNCVRFSPTLLDTQIQAPIHKLIHRTTDQFRLTVKLCNTQCISNEI